MPHMVQKAPLNGPGLASLILGISSLVVCWLGLLSGPAAIITGVIGLNSANKRQLKNKGMATAGLIMGIIGFIVEIIFVIYIAQQPS